MADRRIELPEGVPLLNTYYVYLTGGCNLACQHCWIAPTYQAHGGTGGHLDYDLFALAIEEGLPLGLSSVKLTGGEPLIHPDFVKFVDLIREKELGLVIETNGTLMTESLAHYLKKNSTLSHISVSLDGATAATHDPFRGVKGSFDKAVQGIRYLVEAGFHPQVIMSLHIGNVDEIEALVRLAESIGAGSVKFNLIQSTGRGEAMTTRGRTLDIQRLIQLGKWVEKDLQKNAAISLYYSWPVAFFSIKRLVHDAIGRCGIFSILGILSTGRIAMCGIGMEIPELSYGQIGVDRVADVWYFNKVLSALRHDLPEKLEGVCGDCILREQCLGSCVADNFNQSHRLTAPHWFCQQAEQSGLFPAGRVQK
jgi:SynChlorMet cassette radical SAM/SPASM protein ScmF